MYVCMYVCLFVCLFVCNPPLRSRAAACAQKQNSGGRTGARRRPGATSRKRKARGGREKGSQVAPNLPASTVGKGAEPGPPLARAGLVQVLRRPLPRARHR